MNEGIKDTVTELWIPPPFPAGKVPQVVPGKSNNQDIKGDFSLDQIVIDPHFVDKIYLQAPMFIPATDMEPLDGRLQQK
ncbi:MAG: hypothetical protein L6R40_006999 [Gallowayella cf. fulva]|nr:MAG: hypothetical protein L6R40_006999 [Xanthomendoza cf. fulva]